MKRQSVITCGKVRGLNLITCVLAYTVCIFIFLIPTIEILIILMYVSKNRAQQGSAVMIDRTEAQYKKLNSGR
ncbi:MAG: hypothetical protein WC541_00665 [Dehalococcoidia bacterium]